MSRAQDFENELMDFIESLGATFVDENNEPIRPKEFDKEHLKRMGVTMTKGGKK